MSLKKVKKEQLKIQQHITGFTQTNMRVGQGRAFGRVLTVLSQAI